MFSGIVSRRSVEESRMRGVKQKVFPLQGDVNLQGSHAQGQISG